MKNWLLLLFLFFGILLLVGCAPGPNTVADAADAQGNIAGFWLGLWHGSIAPITFVVSLFSNDVSFYEVHNNGGWYNFGFVLGAGILFGGSGSAASRRDSHKQSED